MAQFKISWHNLQCLPTIPVLHICHHVNRVNSKLININHLVTLVVHTCRRKDYFLKLSPCTTFFTLHYIKSPVYFGAYLYLFIYFFFSQIWSLDWLGHYDMKNIIDGAFILSVSFTIYHTDIAHTVF